MEKNIKRDSISIDIEYRETLDLFKIKAHHHNSYEMIYIFDGAAEFSISNRTYEVHSHHLIFINPFEAHEVRVTKIPYKRYFILIRPDYLHSIIKEPALLSIFKYRPFNYSHILPVSPEDSSYIPGKLANICKEFTGKDIFWETLVESSLTELMVYLYRGYGGHFPSAALDESVNIINKIQRHIEMHCLEDLNLNEISRQFYLDRFYLSHTFKKITGYNFKQYIILQRILKAKDLLYYSGDDITLVGIKSGFNNVNHFIRIFKKYTGTTPYQYRKKFR